jgi:hypothetical protein
MLKTKLEGCTFANPVAMMTKVSTILSNIPLNKVIMFFDE